MENKQNIVYTAEFNPRIKSYLLFLGALLITISLIGIPLLIIWLFGFGQYLSRRYYQNLRCVLTTKNLQFKKGIMFKVEKTIPLENIQDLTFIDNPFLRIFDLRILKVETAGHSNKYGSDMKLIGIIDTESFKEKVMQQRDMLHDRKEDHTASSPLLQELKELKFIVSEIRDHLTGNK